eukprot:749594-Hanusia_phi.AAC.1
MKLKLHTTSLPALKQDVPHILTRVSEMLCLISGALAVSSVSVCRAVRPLQVSQVVEDNMKINAKVVEMMMLRRRTRRIETMNMIEI